MKLTVSSWEGGKEGERQGGRESESERERPLSAPKPLHCGFIRTIRKSASPSLRTHIPMVTRGSSVNIAFHPIIGPPRTGLKLHNLCPMAPFLAINSYDWNFARKRWLSLSLMQDSKYFKLDESDLPQIWTSLCASKSWPLLRQKADQTLQLQQRIELCRAV